MPTAIDRSRVRPDVVAVAGLVALGAAFLIEMLIMDAVPVARDIQLFFVPHKHILWDSLKRLEIPLWTPLIRTGYPVMANFQSGVFYPPHWLYAILPFFITFNLLIVGHLLLGGLGQYLLARKLRFDPGPAWIAAVAFMLGGYLVSLTNLINALQAAAWAPLMAAVLLRHVDRWRPSSAVQMIAVYLLGFLAGEPQTFMLAAGVSLALGLVWAHGGGRGRDGFVRVCASMGIAAVAVAGLAAAQILPTLEMVSRAGRGAGLSLSEAARYSLEPIRTAHLLIPNDFTDPVYRFGRKLQLTSVEPWLFSVYLGIGVLVLAWLSRHDRSRRGQVVLWLSVAFVGVALTLGDHTPLFGWLYEYVPGFSAFRYPEKFFLLSALSIPMLAAHGTSVMVRGTELDGGDAVAGLCALTGGLAAKVAWVSAPDRIHGALRSAAPNAPMLEHFPFAYVEWGQNLDLVLVVLAATVAVILLRRRGHLGGRAFMGVVCVLVSLDLWVAHRGLNPVVDRSFYTDRPAVQRKLPTEQLRTTYRYRASPYGEHLGSLYSFPDLPTEASKWLWQETMQPVTAARWGVLAHDALDAIHLDVIRTSDDLLRKVPRAARHRLLQMASVRWIYYPVVMDHLSRSEVTRLESIPGYLYELSGTLPRTYLAHGREVSGEKQALDAVLSSGMAYRQQVILMAMDTTRSDARFRDGGATGSAGGRSVQVRLNDSVTDQDSVASPTELDGGAVGSARILADEGEEIRVRVEPDTASYLVLTDTWYPGWHAYVDGEERPVRRANYFFKAVRVRPGDETVVFRYRSEPLRKGVLISAGSIVVLVAGLGSWAIRRGRREDADDAPGGSAERDEL